MGGRGSGRIPRPAKLKLVEGSSPGRDSGGRKVPTPPPFERVAPQPPDWLPPEARVMWEATIPDLERLRLLKEVDLGVCTAYCLAWDQLVRAVPLYRDGFLVVNKRSGAIKPNPAIAVARAAIHDVLRLAAELGCSPSAEQRLGELVASDDDGSPNPFAGTWPG